MKTGSILLWAAVAAVILGGGAVAYTQYRQRGIRNNNPGNIVAADNNPWQGQTGSDGRFAVFSDPRYGIRALAKTLQTYRARYGLTTVAGIITRWAPPAENNTRAYIASVCQDTGKGANEPLSLGDYPALIAAIIKHENGVQPYPADLIAQACAMT